MACFANSIHSEINLFIKSFIQALSGMSSANLIDFIAIGAFIIAVLDLFYIWYSNRVQGPKFLLADVWVERAWIPPANDHPPSCRIMSFYANTGDRLGVISTLSASLRVKTKAQEFVTDRLNSSLLEMRMKPNWYEKKVFSFLLPVEAEGWTEGEMTVNVRIIDHEGIPEITTWKFNINSSSSEKVGGR